MQTGAVQCANNLTYIVAESLRATFASFDFLSGSLLEELEDKNYRGMLIGSQLDPEFFTVHPFRVRAGGRFDCRNCDSNSILHAHWAPQQNDGSNEIGRSK